MKQKTKNKKIKRNIAKIFLVFVFSFFVFSLSYNSNGNILNNINAAPLDFLNNFKSPTDLVLEATGDIAKNGLLLVFNYLLYGVWLFVYFCVWIAGMLFDWSINPVNINGIVGSDSVYAGWTIVRDFLNLSFILVLLFSAFATVFQIDKYHLMKKNILLMVVLMALLVNFSFPVARFIIDTTNVTMYFFVEQAFPGYDYTSSSISSHFLDKSNLVGLVVPEGISSVSGDANLTVKLLMLIVFSFLMAVTMIALAGIFLVRIIALAMIVIFAPLGFVGPIFPSFSKLGQWWDYLFKYALVGPVMMFMYLLALRLMEAGIGGENIIGGASLKRFSENYEVPGSSNFMATAASLIIPMIIMWISILMAGSMGVYGANKIVGFAKGAGMKFGGYNWGKRRYDAYKAERKRRSDEIFKGNLGEKLGGGVNKLGQWKDLGHSKLMIGEGDARFKRFFGAKNAKNRIKEGENKEIIKRRKEWKDDNRLNEAFIQEKFEKGDDIDKKVSAMYMAESYGFGKDDTFYPRAKMIVNDNASLKEEFGKKIKENRIDLFIKKKIDDEAATSGTVITEDKKKEIAKKELSGLNLDKWSKQNFKGLGSDAIIREVAREEYEKMSPDKQSEFRRKISGTQEADAKEAKIIPNSVDGKKGKAGFI